jgi:hypothetical protein
MGILLLLIVAFALLVIVFGIMKDAPQEKEDKILESQGDTRRCPSHDGIEDLYTEEKYKRFCDEYRDFTALGPKHKKATKRR